MSDWNLTFAEKWGETERTYPNGTIIRVMRNASGGWVADLFRNLTAYENDEWEIDSPLAGALFATLADATAAADALN